jgi:protein gp37
MGDKTLISWTDHTFNPWWGCARWSPGCKNCYADTLARRWGMDDLWHKNGPRRMMSENQWRQPARWNREAAAAGVRAKVFCASMADVFEDHPAVTRGRKRLFGVIEDTPWLTWQLLTKRIENVAGMVPWGGSWPANAWIGTSVENQDLADERIPELLRLDAAPVRFLSCEPLIGPLNLIGQGGDAVGAGIYALPDAPEYDDGEPVCQDHGAENCTQGCTFVDWVICGGESGPGHRPMEIGWAESVVSQCQDARVPVWTKQDSGPRSGQQGRIPDELWLHEFPAVA